MSTEPTRLETQLVSSLTLANVRGRLRAIADDLDDYTRVFDATAIHGAVMHGFALDVRACIELLDRFKREQLSRGVE